MRTKAAAKAAFTMADAMKRDLEQREATARQNILMLEPAIVAALERVVKPEDMDAIRKQRLLLENAYAVVSGCERQRTGVRTEYDAAAFHVKVADMAEALPAQEAAQDAAELVEEAVDVLGAVWQKARAAIALGPEDRRAGLREHLSEPAIARWIWTLVSRSGIDLEKAKLARDDGATPDAVLAALRSAVETL